MWRCKEILIRTHGWHIRSAIEASDANMSLVRAWLGAKVNNLHDYIALTITLIFMCRDSILYLQRTVSLQIPVW